MEEANEVWLEAMKNGFEQAIAEGNYALSKNIIQSVRDEGFDKEARELHNQLMEATLGDFLVESDPRFLK